MALKYGDEVVENAKLCFQKNRKNFLKNSFYILKNLKCCSVMNYLQYDKGDSVFMSELNLNLKRINKDSKFIKDIENLYKLAFPSNERIPFLDIINSSFPNSKLLGIFKNEELLGFTFTSIYKNFLYLVYLAIDQNKRNKGYGTTILKKLKERYNNKTIVLCCEKPLDSNSLEARRINFYKRNGFLLADFEFSYLSQVYYACSLHIIDT